MAGKSVRITKANITENRMYRIYFKSGNKIKISLNNRQSSFMSSYQQYIETGSPEGVVQAVSGDQGLLAIKWSEIEAIHEVYG